MEAEAGRAAAAGTSESPVAAVTGRACRGCGAREGVDILAGLRLGSAVGRRGARGQGSEALVWGRGRCAELCAPGTHARTHIHTHAARAHP